MKNDPPNMPDDQLDDLFRKAASGFEPPFDPEAWKRMEQKLDGDRYFQTKLKRFTLIEGIVILTMMGLFWFSSQAVQPEDTGVRKAPGESMATTSEVSDLKARSERSLNVIDSSSIHTLETNRPLSVSQPELKPGVSKQPVELANKSMYPRAAVTPKQASRKSFAAVASRNKSGHKRSDSDPLDLDTETETLAGSPHSASDSSLDDTVAAFDVSRLKPASGPLLPVDLSWQTPELESAPEKPAKGPYSRWALQLMLSPDFTQVPGRAAATGYNTGLQLEYRFAPRWRASAGIIYSLKNYSASSYDYRPYPGYWAAYKRPDAIDAACRMLDVPLTITYDVWKWKQNQFFVSVGSTSYLMLKEDYYYQYPTYSYELEKNRTGNHWLATANISLGVERPILPRLMVRIEPFVKTPLGGVGFGNVRLRSSGVFFSLRYQLKNH